jgi:hypothetical protein
LDLIKIVIAKPTKAMEIKAMEIKVEKEIMVMEMESINTDRYY